MAKLAPKDRWLKHLEELIVALRFSGKLQPLQKKGLAALHRRKKYTAEEWTQSFHQRAASPEYLKWHEECQAVANEFGLAPWVVTMMCLIKYYKPEKDIGFLVMERYWPRARVVTESTNRQFLARLSNEAQQLGLYVIQKVHGVETALLNLEPVADVTIPWKSGKEDVFTIDFQIPLGYPPEATEQLLKKSDGLARELARRMGQRVPQRLRSSKLVKMAKTLEADKGQLPRNKAYDIIDKVYRDKANTDGSPLYEDQRRRKLTASRRHKVRKRLFKPNNKD
jgi:hypothetical protein